MEPTTELDLEMPEALYRQLGTAAVANRRTLEEEIIARLTSSLGSEGERKIISSSNSHAGM
jgi:hypothetical protein